ncbi:hypothetical protein AAFF_G00093020 [Aldrovandia affinis]|uniref:Uncharacterized protein n=1 Tax=Aldrovandia affinis TaxID=143900 RepID=A0AAD7WXJ0_9TELE|nr:hypothetical protein AAFF_G00093020 [Aldrovandia affinis]
MFETPLWILNAYTQHKTDVGYNILLKCAIKQSQQQHFYVNEKEVPACDCFHLIFSCLFLVRVAGGWSLSQHALGREAGIHPGQVANPSQGTTYTIHSHTHTYGQIRLQLA